MKMSHQMRVMFICMFFGLFFVVKYFDLGIVFEPHKQVELYNPYISTETWSTPVLTAQETASDVPVSCVLSYGTFFVPQQDCDFLNERDSAPLSTAQYGQCVVQGGTFLVTEDECALLLRSSGSQDVMQRIDE